MAFPKQQNRRIVVREKTYIWYLKRNEIFMDSKHIAVRDSESAQGQLLLVDVYAHDFEIRPRMIKEAIEFALTTGWKPEQKGVPLYVGFDNVQFLLLPPGEQYTRTFQPPPSLPSLRQNGANNESG